MKFWERFGIAIMSAWGLFAVHQGVNALVRSHNWQPMTISDWGTWLGSIGTVATLIGTIHLATAETRRRVRQELITAKLQCVSIERKLEHAAARLDLIKSLLDDLIAGPENQPIRVQAIRGQMAELEDISFDAILSLAALPTNAAEMVAQTDSNFRRLKLLAELLVDCTPSTQKERAKEMLPWVAMSHEMAIGTKKRIQLR